MILSYQIEKGGDSRLFLSDLISYTYYSLHIILLFIVHLLCTDCAIVVLKLYSKCTDSAQTMHSEPYPNNTQLQWERGVNTA